MSNVKLFWFVDKGNISTRFSDEVSAAKYAAVVGGVVRKPHEAEGMARVDENGTARMGIGAKLFAALRKEN
jgi:hypothetical protein